jgi:hypothetical protein
MTRGQRWRGGIDGPEACVEIDGKEITAQPAGDGC